MYNNINPFFCKSNFEGFPKIFLRTAFSAAGIVNDIAENGAENSKN